MPETVNGPQPAIAYTDEASPFRVLYDEVQAARTAWLNDMLGSILSTEPAPKQPRLPSRRAKAARKWLEENRGSEFARWLGKVRCYAVRQWVGESSMPHLSQNRQEKVVAEADVFSSLLKRAPDGSRARMHQPVLDLDYHADMVAISTSESRLTLKVPGGIPEAEQSSLVESLVRHGVVERNRVAVMGGDLVLDIDYRAHLIPSSTEGHFHLILEVPDGIPHNDYMDLLDVLGKYNVVELGYAAASRDRGHSDIRLPWVKKKAEEKKVSVREERTAGPHLHFDLLSEDPF